MKFVTPKIFLTIGAILMLGLGGGWFFMAEQVVLSGLPDAQGNDLFVMKNLSQMFGAAALMVSTLLLTARTLEPAAAKKMSIGAGGALAIMAGLMVRNFVIAAPWGGPPVAMIVIMSTVALTLLVLGLKTSPSQAQDSQL